MADFVTMGARHGDYGQTMELSLAIRQLKIFAEIGISQSNLELHVLHSRMVVMRGTTTPVMW